jgi:hypothetical protein
VLQHARPRSPLGAGALERRYRLGAAPLKGNDDGLAATRTGLNAAATRADSDFARAMAVPEALLALRDELPPKQWVSRDVALNRSVVVLTVAAWQAWVETYVGTALAAMAEPPANRSEDTEYLHLLHATGPLIELATREVGRFSTPDAGEVCRLLRLLGDDPRPRWSFASAAGRTRPDEVVSRLDGWVKVRHAIAHGHGHLPPVDVLGRTKGGHGSLTHRHAAQCTAFFRELAVATGHQG